jgi:hypothetical protein
MFKIVTSVPGANAGHFVAELVPDVCHEAQEADRADDVDSDLDSFPGRRHFSLPIWLAG